jgi:prepilin-type N-terminal cleavage/methylation domain-containing protein
MRDAFTLVEILMVITVIATLTAVALPAIRGARECALRARAQAELAVVVQALESYRRAFGDYPRTGDFAEAQAGTDAPLGIDAAQAKLFNALRGVFGPRAFGAGDRLGGDSFIDAGKLTLESIRGEDRADSADAGRDAGTETCTALLDPWGRRYLYYYRSASDPLAWRRGTYLLYSAGSDGLHAPPDRFGDEPTADAAARVNADNVCADAGKR